MGSVVVVVVLTFTELIVEQVDVVGNAIFVQELIELLRVDAM